MNGNRISSKLLQGMAIGMLTPMMVCSSVSAQDMDKGQRVYEQVCAGCHQARGEGVSPIYPKLDGNTFVQENGMQVVHLVLNGRGGMPSFRDELTLKEVVDVITYIRQAWGNKGNAISEQKVRRLLSEVSELSRLPRQGGAKQ